MESRELRIGNLVYFRSTNKDIAEINAIEKTSADCVDEYGAFVPNGDYIPIPLTEEILLKLPDFERLHQSLFKTRDGKYSLHETISGSWIFYRDSTHLCFAKSLHHLQNLFYFLEDREMIINSENK